MKNIPPKVVLLLLPVLMLALSGCPVGLDYSAGKPASEKCNSKLIGTWQFTPTDSAKEAEVMEFVLTRGENDKTLNATVKERGEMYALETDALTGYETNIEGLHILYFKPENEAKFYHYQYVLDDDNTLVVADVSLLDGGVDAVTSVESLREQINRSRTKPGFYKEPRTFKRIK